MPSFKWRASSYSNDVGLLFHQVLMTACTMPSDYGVELMLGSSPVVGSGFHGSGSSFFSDYPRCGSPAMLWDNPNNTNTSYYPGNLMTSNATEPSDNCRSYARTGSLRRSKKLNKLKAEFQQRPLLLTIPAKSILRTQDELPQVRWSTINMNLFLLE